MKPSAHHLLASSPRLLNKQSTEVATLPNFGKSSAKEQHVGSAHALKSKTSTPDCWETRLQCPGDFARHPAGQKRASFSWHRFWDPPCKLLEDVQCEATCCGPKVHASSNSQMPYCTIFRMYLLNLSFGPLTHPPLTRALMNPMMGTQRPKCVSRRGDNRLQTWRKQRSPQPANHRVLGFSNAASPWQPQCGIDLSAARGTKLTPEC